ncbi:MAG: MerR family transcriptional regulator [Roseobacter sp.]
MPKSADAFRTISEVADWLGVQAHVLRFWESKFAQVKPIKRAGGRRYYRPADMLLIGGIKKLLHDDGLTIKGAQKLLREQGVAFVADQSQPLDDLTMAVIEGAPAEDDAADVIDAVMEEPTNSVQAEETPAVEEMGLDQEPESAAIDVDPVADATHPPLENPVPDAPPAVDLQEDAPSEPVLDQEAVPAPEPEPEPAADAAPETPAEPEVSQAEPLADAMPSFRARPRPTEPVAEPEVPTPTVEATPEAPESDSAPREPDVVPPALEEIALETPAFTPSEPTPAPKPLIIDLPAIPDLADIDVAPSALTALTQVKQISPDHAQSIKPLLARLTRLRASMGNPRKEIRKD